MLDIGSVTRLQPRWWKRSPFLICSECIRSSPCLPLSLVGDDGHVRRLLAQKTRLMFSGQLAVRRGMLVLVVLLLLVGVAAYIVRFSSDPRDPSPGSAAYQQLTSSFYTGLAALQAGLLDRAEQDLLRASQIAPQEPAIWANLGLLHLRLGNLDQAAAYLERGQGVASGSAPIAVLQGLVESRRGRLEDGVAHLRRAVELDPGDLKALYLLAQEVERAGGSEGDTEAQRLLEALLEIQPMNLAVLLERARIAGKRNDIEALQDSVGRLGANTNTWPDVAVSQYRDLEQETQASDVAQAAVHIAFLRNTLLRTPTFSESLFAVTTPSEVVAYPLERFLEVPAPSSTPAAADNTLSFSPQPFADEQVAEAVLVAPLTGDDVFAVFAGDARQVRRLDAPNPPLPFPGGDDDVAPTANGLLALDWNNDFRMDLVLVGAGGISLFRLQDDESLADVTAGTGLDASVIRASYDGAWAADIEMDGDLDIIASRAAAGPLVLRNNADGTWTDLRPFPNLGSLRVVAWGDFDRDGDPDAAFLDATGALHLFLNQQAGRFQRAANAPNGLGELVALGAADLNADGVLDLVGLDGSGVVRRASLTTDGAAWVTEQVAAWANLATGTDVGTHRLLLADLDNNGAVDLVGSGPTGSQVWLGDEQGTLAPHRVEISADLFGVADLSGDGRLDLVGLVAGQPTALMNQGEAPYHWQVIRPRAQMSAGDQRINSFGVGGEIEIRSGPLFQKQLLSGAPAHFGLGTRTSIEVARIVWPNGVVQAEFDLGVDQAIEAQQRLKGSCPWVFAYDGTGMQFVTDFLWRSPLGLRINAQETGSVTQTEDWVRITGKQLVPKDGSYDLRITAELWETHFLDHISLMAVDHPSDLSVWVDERFAPGQRPALTVHATSALHPLERVWDDSGHDVSDLVASQDGLYLGAFEPGVYQGVTRDHFVEFDINADVSPDTSVWLVSQGWVYPTDSSINAAMAQGRHAQPRGVALEARNQAGDWVIVHPDLGFPAGKNKTMLIDLSPALDGDRMPRLRLRTNLEIYWDRLAYATGVENPPLETTRLAPEQAELQYRGFSKTTLTTRNTPEVPSYEIANTLPRWRDLVGYHTRFGDVRELLARVDDRYVILNAGDELRLLFEALLPPRPGWTRDFVLVGDGWVKDGDYNTAFSKTVGPLPAHHRPDYREPLVELEHDPVYRRYPEDWQLFHTRFIRPRAFLEGLRPRSVSVWADR